MAWRRLLARTEVNRLNRAGQISLIAARQAVEDAGDTNKNPERTAVSWGTGIGLYKYRLECMG